MTTIDTRSAPKNLAAPAERPLPKAEGTASSEGPAPQVSAAGDDVPGAIAQSARYRLMREANALSAESSLADTEMARELTASVRDMILSRGAESVRIQSGSIPREAFRLLD